MKKRGKQLKKGNKSPFCKKAGYAKAKGPFLSLPKSSSKPVFVDAFNAHLKSPHIVNLRQKDKQDIWGRVQPYAEKSTMKEERRIVDFAELVKRSNLIKKPEAGSQKPEVVARKNIKHIFYIYLTYISNKCLIFCQYFSNILSTFRQGLQHFFTTFTFKRFSYLSIIVLILMGLPFPAIGYYRNLKQTSAKIVEASADAFMSLQSSTIAAFQSNLDQAKYDLNEALISFGRADSLTEKDMWLVKYVGKLLPIIGPQVLSRQHLLTAGHHLALGNTYLIKGIEMIQAENDIFITERMDILQKYLQSALPQYKQALEELGQVGLENIPTEHQHSFNDFKLLFAVFIDDLSDLSDLCKALQAVLGSDQLKRYLLIFQNNQELRPTGGFIGSFAVVDVQKGKIINLDMPAGGSYDLKGQLGVYLKPPLPLQLVNKKWEFQDANWFPDFSASARKIEWFYEQSRGATLDGVIAVNASVLERALAVLGPVESASLGAQIDKENVLAWLRTRIEEDKIKEENKPKQALGDLAGELILRLSQLKTKDVLRLLTELNNAAGQKEIQTYFNATEVQRIFRDFGWAGEIWKTGNAQDYLMVVSANLQGEKSDVKIYQNIEHQAVVGDDGSITDMVIVTRSHKGSADESPYGANNVNYIRVYAPKGAELIDAGGFIYPPEGSFHVSEDWYKTDADLANYEKEVSIHAKTGTRITEEFGKTVFGNWMMTAPGESSNVYFVYILPFKAASSKAPSAGLAQWTDFVKGTLRHEASHYSLAVQKQSGVESKFSFRLIYPNDWHPVWEPENTMNLASNGATLETVLNSDKVLGIAMERDR